MPSRPPSPEPEDPIVHNPGPFGRLALFILHNRALALVVLSIMVLGTAAGAALLDIDFSAKAFYGSHDPEVDYLEGYIERWGDDEVAMVVVRAEQGDLLTHERMAIVDEVTRALREDDAVSRADSLPNLPGVRRSLIGPMVPITLLATMPTEEGAALDDWREDRLADPLIVPAMLSEDGKTAAILVRIDGDTDDLQQVRGLVRRLREIVEPYEGREGLSFEWAGIPTLRASVIDGIVADQVVFVPISAVAVVFLLVLMYRSRHGVMVPGIAALVPLVILLGVMGYVGEPIGLLNQSYFVLIPAIAIADAIHLVSRYHEETTARIGPGSRHTTKTNRGAIVEAMKHMGVACFLTSFTTVVGFLSLYATDMPVLQRFGVFAAIGIGAAYFTVLFIIPLTLSVTRSGVRLTRQDASGWMGHALDACARTAITFPKTALAVTAVIVAGAVFAATLVEVDTKLSETLAPDHPVTHTNHVVDAELGGLTGLDFELTGPPGTFEDLEVLKALERAEAAALLHPEVRLAISPAGMVSAAGGALGGPQALPDDPTAVPPILAAIDVRAGTHRLINEDRSRARLLIRTTDLGANRTATFSTLLDEEMRTIVGEAGVEAHLTGTTWVSYRGLNGVTTDLRNSLMVAFGIIALLIATLFRSIRLGLLSLLPNAIPLLLAYGAMGVFGWLLDSAPAVVFTVALGLSVDSTIHVMARFTEERRAGRLPALAIREAVLHSGRGITITSVILAVAFAVNGLSSFPDNRIFGVLGAIIVMGALLANLVVLPALLAVLFRASAATLSQAQRAPG